MDVSQDIPFGYCQCGCGQKTRLAPRSATMYGWVKGQPLRFVNGHATRKRGPDYETRDCGYVTPCWVWIRTKLDPEGYAYARHDGRTQKMYRVYYECHIGPIPEGLVLDHLCRVRACVNPTHVEPVTWAENIRRGNPGVADINAAKTHCPQGHPLVDGNLVKRAKGRECQICRRAACRRYHQRKRDERKAA